MLASAPDDRVARRDLATTLHRIGTFLDDKEGDLQGAVAAEREALGLIEGLVAADPDDVDETRVLLSVNTKLGDLLMRTGKPKEALAVFEKALPGYESLATRTTRSARPLQRVRRRVEGGRRLRGAGPLRGSPGPVRARPRAHPGSRRRGSP